MKIPVRYDFALLILSSFTEVVWNIGLKRSNGLTDWRNNSYGVFFLMVGILCFKKSLDSISLSVAAIIWSGLSLTLTIVADVVLFKTRTDLLTCVFMLLCLVSIIGLNYATNR